MAFPALRGWVAITRALLAVQASGQPAVLQAAGKAQIQAVKRLQFAKLAGFNRLHEHVPLC